MAFYLLHNYMDFIGLSIRISIHKYEIITMEIHFRKSGYPCEANRIKYNLNKLKLFSRKLVRYVKDYLFNNVFLKVFTKF